MLVIEDVLLVVVGTVPTREGDCNNERPEEKIDCKLPPLARVGMCAERKDGKGLIPPPPPPPTPTVPVAAVGSRDIRTGNC